MGFFSSRKAEPTRIPISEESSVKVIRSRFYGKSKGNVSSGRSSPLPTASSLPPSLPVRKPETHIFDQSPSSVGRPTSADALTMSLAQRLNELAAANADGLLDDEEYRLLRQNLFERFATGSDSPTEAPVVPISTGAGNRNPYHHVTRPPSVDSQRSIATAVSSLFRRATGRSSSVTSPAPSASGSTSGSIFSLQQQMSPAGESSSVYSRPSFSSGAPRSASFPRSVSRRPSDDSLMSTSQAGSGSASGSVTNDLRGIMSRHQVLGGTSVHYASSISSRATTRSAKPPSSFHLRQLTASTRLTRTHEDDDQDDHPKTAAELCAEIESVESEGRKLLDAFSGLELTALTKPRSVGPLSAPPDVNPSSRRLSIYPDASPLGSSYTLIPDRAAAARKNGHTPTHVLPLVKQPVNLKRKPSVVGSIAGSFKSSASDLRGGFLSSAPQPLHSSRSSPNLLQSTATPPIPALPTSTSAPTAGSSVNKRPSILRQKQPTYPVTGLSRGPHTAPPLPVRPSALSHRTNANGTDPALHALEVELADIRRRKTDVSARYERRLEFLRAKLKSAEIRERLSKK